MLVGTTPEAGPVQLHVAAVETSPEAGMPLRRVPRRPLSSLSFEATRQIHSGKHSEWAKYVIGA